VQTLWRATAWLYDMETRSSYAIEHEAPKPGRAERFVAALRDAWRAEPMSRELLVRVQNSVVEADYAEPRERTKQNWVGRTTATFEEEVHLVPPTPEALPEILDAWITLANRVRARGLTPGGLPTAFCSLEVAHRERRTAARERPGVDSARQAGTPLPPVRRAEPG